MKRSLLFFLITISQITIFYGQEKPILVYDFVSGLWDSIPQPTYDTTLQNGKTVYDLGSFNTTVEVLEQTPSPSNTYPNSQFTFKKRADLDFDLTDYPIRTSVKLFFEENDTLNNLCSGSLISRKHVLTAAHCISAPNTNTLFVDSLYVSPIFNNGNSNSNFNNSYVSKVYFFRDWNFAGEDMAILELEEPIGEATGWLSIGFNSVDSTLLEGIFYKFTYPSATTIIIDSNEYNGDSLYYNYGVVDIATNNSIGINGTSGIGGESGSSLIKVINNQEYTSYGTLSFANNLSHSRINNWRFYALQNIIKDDLILDLTEITDKFKLSLYPNPTTGIINIGHVNREEVLGLSLLDNLGNNVPIQYKNDKKIDVSNLPNGIYFLRIMTSEFIETQKVIKTSN